MPGTNPLYDEKLKGLHDQIEVLRREVQTAFVSLNKALELQAAEYERRLADLNHEAARITAAHNTYQPREKAEEYKNVHGQAHEELRVWQTKIETTMAEIATRAATWLVAVSVGFTALSITLTVISMGVTVALKVIYQ